MAEKQMEAIQRSRRKADYDSLSESEEEGVPIEEVHPRASSIVSSSIRHRPRRGNVKSKIATMKTTHSVSPVPVNSLLDDNSTSTSSFELQPILSDHTTIATPGMAGFLEIEEEPPRPSTLLPQNWLVQEVDDDGDDDNHDDDSGEPIKTTSGLLLTHRRSPTNQRPRSIDTLPDLDDPQQRLEFLSGSGAFRKPPVRDYFEVENGLFFWNMRGHSGSPRHSRGMLQLKRILSYMKVSVVLSFVGLLALTGVLVHSFQNEQNQSIYEMASPEKQRAVTSKLVVEEIPQAVLLLPMENISALKHQKHAPIRLLGTHHENKIDTQHHHHQTAHSGNKRKPNDHVPHGHRVLLELQQLRNEFETWVRDHGKNYHSHEEKEHRFRVWTDNHHR